MVTVLKRSEGRKLKAAAAQVPQAAMPGAGDSPPVTPPAPAAAPTVENMGSTDPGTGKIAMSMRVGVPGAWPFPPGVDVLDALVDAGADRVAQLMLWKQRIENPELAIQITEADIRGFAECSQYLDIKPALLIWRRPAVEAQPGQPATARRRAVAPTPYQPPANHVTVRLVVQGTHDGFKPIENNEADYDATKAAEKLRQVKQDLPQLAMIVRQQIASGDYSTAVLTEFVDGAMVLAKAP